MAQDWEYNGVNLTTYAYNVQLLGTGPDIPARRGENIVIPGKTGTYYTARKPLHERRMSLAMWVKDVDPSTGASPSESQLLTNLDTLRQLFGKDGTALLKHSVGTVVRQAPAEIVSAVEFEPFGTAPYYRFVVEFSMANPLWQAQAGTVFGPTDITTSPQNITLVNNGTYRNEHGTIAVTGQIVNPKFEVDSKYVEYTGTVAAGGTLTIDCTNWVATNGTIDVSGDITYTSGEMVWLSVPVGTAVTMAVTGTSLGTATETPTVTVSYTERFI